MSDGRGGKKRHSSQPLAGNAKDARAEQEQEIEEIEEDASSRAGETWSEVASRGRGRGGFQTSNRFGLLAQSSSYPDKSMRSASICSRGSRGSARAQRGATQIHQRRTDKQNDRPTDLGDNTRFVTPAPDGAMRDEIVVECRTINDAPFRGTITFKEAREVIFGEVMGFELKELYSIRFRYNGCPVIKFKLKNQINLDDLLSVEYFNLERQSPNNRDTDYIGCRIMGIRGSQSVPHYDGQENDVRWVKIEGTEYQLTQEQIVQGLIPFGEVLTPVREDIFQDSDSDLSEIVGNGTYSVKMKLERPIPQYLPMHGKKIRVYHNGISKLCTNCFEKHTRRQCRNQKKNWLEYVRDFMDNHPHLAEDYFGKWWDIVDLEYPGHFSYLPDENQAQIPETIVRPTETKKDLPRIDRDPRIAKRQMKPQAQTTQPEATNNQTAGYDRQREMSRLIANGLTLTDARRYLANVEEMESMNRQMNQGSSGLSFRQTGSNDNQLQGGSTRGSYRGRSYSRGTFNN